MSSQPIVDTNGLLGAVQLLASSGLFDAAWYLERYPDVKASGIDPLLHYVQFGSGEGRWPNRYFDGEWYLRTYPDVGAAGLDPFVHYLRYGDVEGRRPHPYFDAGWYRTAYQLPADTLAMQHFLTRRPSGQVAPCQELYAVAFIAPYKDYLAKGMDPFAVYLDEMDRQRREAFPDYDIVTNSGLIDANYYLINGSDVYESAIDPALHYCRFGWREHRRPNIYFDPVWYAETNPDVARLQVNPLVHYLVEGERRNRRPVPYFDPGWYRETYGIPEDRVTLAHYLTHRRSQKVSPNPMFDVAWYVAQHLESMGPNRDPFAHYLQAGTLGDQDPSPGFNAAEYRRQHLGRVSRGMRHVLRPDRDNPLVHYLRAQYLNAPPA